MYLTSALDEFVKKKKTSALDALFSMFFQIYR
jgi:hypothetical protein